MFKIIIVFASMEFVPSFIRKRCEQLKAKLAKILIFRTGIRLALFRLFLALLWLFLALFRFRTVILDGVPFSVT